jgi:hypothetical protein
LDDKQCSEKIVVSNTFTQEWEMEYYFDLAKEYGYRVYSLIVENRHGGVNEHGVPEEKLVQMKKRFEITIMIERIWHLMFNSDSGTSRGGYIPLPKTFNDN